MRHDDPVVTWLLDADEPAIELAVRTDLCDEPAGSAGVVSARDRVPSGSLAGALLSGQASGGGFGVHPYKKWSGAHWRLISLVEAGIPPAEPRCLAALDDVLGWLTSGKHRRRHLRLVDGRYRRCASQEGYALYVASRLGSAADPRVGQLASSLLEWQWPDGGWNCDVRPEASHSSFHETLPPLRGLHAYGVACGDAAALAAADRAAELLLRHRLYRSESTGAVIDQDWLLLRHPAYWHYGVLPALRALGCLGRLGDPRAGEALDLLESRRLPDGRWAVDGCWWRPPRNLAPGARPVSGTEVARWGRSGPDRWVTLEALRVLRRAGRVQ
jgi:hypothetical protein